VTAAIAAVTADIEDSALGFYLPMKPGLTGLWQVSGRNRLPFEEMVRLDLFYIENWSLLLDLKIILRTVLVMIEGH